MKKLFYIAWLCLTLAACSREELPESGSPASLILSVNTMQNDEKTRAVSPDIAEKRIFNLYIFVFNADGSIDYQQYHTFNSVIESKKLSINGLTCGSGKSVAIVANIDNANTIISIKKTTLDNITSRSELDNIIVSMQNQAIERGTNFLTSGVAENITVSADAATPVTVLLKRIDAKIRFNITTKAGVTFTPRDWRIVSIPRRIRLMTAYHDLCASPNDCFTTDWAKFEEGGATFAFYSMEHIMTPKSLIPDNGTNAERYALREKQHKLPTGPGNSVTNGDFIYAPPTGTYVEMRGNVSYTASMGVEISADVIYTVHLGGVDGVNDYNTHRNTFYTYNVKILSVNAIETEVTQSDAEEKELRPGAEGDVTLAKFVKNLDAHNETLMLNFGVADVDETLTWNVSTHFSEGSEVDNPLDYTWIYFRINTKNAAGLRYTDTYRPYLGDQNIYQGDVSLATYMNDVDKNIDKMLNVKQLTALLKESKKIYLQPGAKHLFDSDYNAKFTAYVNEYYYETSPVDPSATATKGLWKQFTNQPQRVMNILSKLKYSPDHESSRTTAVYSIRQHSIQTMYSRTLNEDYTAWGTQRVQDETPVRFDSNNRSYVDNATHHSNGRQNTIALWGVPSNWNTYVAQDSWSMQTNYNTAKYKCLRMNRDNDGDGRIDEDEVQWYLAAINQLTDIWIGEWSYDPAARLYKNTTWVEQYFVSSTVSGYVGIFLNRKDDPQILWSSEGSSIGNLNAAEGGSGIDTPVYYRCVRNLGVPRNAAKEIEPSGIADYNPTTKRISLKRLDAQSIRSYYQMTEELPMHNEREATNKPYWEFEVSTTPVGDNNYTWTSLFNYIQSGARLCPNGYRLPNQRELALMLSRIGQDGNWTLDNHFSRTSFSFSTSTNYRPGFAVSSTTDILFLVHQDDESGGVRCVRDYVTNRQ